MEQLSCPFQISQEHLKQLFEYRDGELYWRITLNPNRVKIGDKAGSLLKKGYSIISIRNRRCYTHRLIWIYHKGTIPQGMQIDHKDIIKSHNRIDNLRLATNSQNQYNTKTKSRTGFKGVCHDSHTGKWRARIKMDKKSKDLGYYDTPELASNAYKQAANKHHGEFARY